VEQNLAHSDVSREETAVLFDGAPKVSTSFIGMPTFEQLTPHFIHASDQQSCFYLLFRGREIGFKQAVLNLKRFTPSLHADIEIPFPNERRQVIRFNLEDFLERLKCFLVTFGIFQILA
jgi:hypothetical protein